LSSLILRTEISTCEDSSLSTIVLSFTDIEDGFK
jgi:hypothetical protein